MAYCTNCGRKIEETFDFCPECGSKITTGSRSSTTEYINFEKNERMKICPECNAEMPEDAFYCLNCGKPFENCQNDFEEVQMQVKRQFGTWKNKWVALILCICLGWIGAHRYYEGKIITALIYTFTLGFFGIGWVIDIIRLALKPNPYLAKR